MRFYIADDFHPSIFPLLEEQGWEYGYFPEAGREDIRSALQGYEGLLIRSKTRVDEDLLAGITSLKLVGRCGSGMDNIDTDYLESRGIKALNAPEGNRNSVGDHVLGMILGLTKNIVRSSRQIKEEGSWLREENRGVELNDLTVGIIGFGNTGSAVALRLTGFGSRILVFDKFRSGLDLPHVEEAGMDQLFEQSDVLSLHIPLNNDTNKLVDDTFLSSFRKPIYLVNTSRGEILDTKALVKGLRKGTVIGAALDVLENEKLNTLDAVQRETFEFLQNSPNVILTPHIAGWSHQSHRLLNEVLVKKIKSWLE